MKLRSIVQRIRKWRAARKVFLRWTESERTLDLLPGYRINKGERIKLGIGVHFGNNIFIDARGGLDIGTNVIFAPDISILTYNHDFRDPEWKPYSPRDIHLPVTIGDNCWIGKSAIILPGTRIGANCIVGAGSVVHGRVPDHSIVRGNPARIIGNTEFRPDAKQYQVIHGNLRRFG